ncbi:MAG: outer membrane beta-barrel protein [Polaribacter sp.]
MDLAIGKSDEAMNKFGLGLGVGVGYDVNKHFFFSTRYSFGLSNRLSHKLSNKYDISDIYDVSDVLNLTSIKFSYFQLGLGYRF